MQDFATSDKRSAGSLNMSTARPFNPLLSYSAETIGTFMLVLVGTAVATAAALGKGTAGPAYNSLAVALSFGFILTPIVGALGPVSGAHVNPAVTLGLAIAGKFPWRHVPGYVIAQTIGAIIAALAVWAAYGHGAFYDSHLGAPSPVNGAGVFEVLLVEALIAFILVLTVLFTATDPRVPPGIAAVAIGFALVAGVFLGGPVSGGAGNLARAIGPMVVTGHFPVWFFYVIGPLLGAAVAAVVFRLIGHADAPTMSVGGVKSTRADPEPHEPATAAAFIKTGSVVGLVEDVSEQMHGVMGQVVDQVIGHAREAGDTAVREMRGFAAKSPIAAAVTALGVGTAIGVALKLGRR